MLLSIGFSVLIAGFAFAQAPSETTWFTIVAGDGAVLGHGSSEVAPGAHGREIIDSQHVSLREQGGEPTRIVMRTVRSEDAAGRTLSIVETAQTGRARSRTEGRIDGSSAVIVRETQAGRWSGTVALPAGVVFDDGEALLRSWDPAATPRLEFANFDLDAMGVDRVIVEAAAGGARDAEGRFTALRLRYQGETLIGIARITIDRDGRVVDIAQPMFGATIHIRATDRATAERRHPPYAVVPNMMTQSPFRIATSATRGHIRYRLAFRDGLDFPLPQTGEQRAVLSGDEVTVDICCACGAGLATDDATLADALRPTAWLQSDDPRIRAIVESIARMDTTDARKMALLIERARPYLERIDFAGHYSALDTINRRAGDCTEAAVLLAAFGRAAGIPTKVVSGLVYSRASYHGVANSFMPHSWTLAYVDGQWRSFDLALNEFDSTHIALTIGDGDARTIAAAGQLASLLRFDGMVEVRSR